MSRKNIKNKQPNQPVIVETPIAPLSSFHSRNWKRGPKKFGKMVLPSWKPQGMRKVSSLEFY